MTDSAAAAISQSEAIPMKTKTNTKAGASPWLEGD
ncbi:hypothetical protein PPSIR1_29078 [Plesiocystis pacifica SIR-1]|uniref:Uncharacterized protein n=1 Tax=Plesiocystis pacifica SIR-1 TaxID=391625 RepID=A6GHU7_9BACT|nr:hypothetical protein PPSIR1_29078 [Plesiocystis pacifica SIR-1]